MPRRDADAARHRARRPRPPRRSRDAAPAPRRGAARRDRRRERRHVRTDRAGSRTSNVGSTPWPSTLIPFSIRRTSPARTFPGPISSARSTPSAREEPHGLDPAHRRVDLAHAARRAELAPRTPARASTLVTTGIRGVREGGRLEERPHPLARGRHEGAVEGRRDGQRDRAFGAPRQCTPREARATAAAWPAMTVCSGELKLAGETDLALRGLPAGGLDFFGRRAPRSPPSRPTPAGTASCMNRPRCADQPHGVGEGRARRPRRPPSTRRASAPRRRRRLRAARESAR